MVMSRGWRVSAGAGAALVGLACQASEPLPRFDETPAVSLLITPEIAGGQLPPGAPPRPDSGLFATLVTTGIPVRSPYLQADRFEMRRVSDGARYAWRPFPTQRDFVAYAPQELGNYFLPRATSGVGLGSDSIAPGTVYELAIDAGAFRLVGRTRVPGRVEFVREPTDGDSVVRWRTAVGAAVYGVGGDIYAVRRIADTAVVILRGPPLLGQTPNIVSVFAYDSNYAAFGGDLRASQAGMSGGWGVFGSYTSAELELPPRAASTTPVIGRLADPRSAAPAQATDVHFDEWSPTPERVTSFGDRSAQSHEREPRLVYFPDAFKRTRRRLRAMAICSTCPALSIEVPSKAITVRPSDRGSRTRTE
jgi:hypothetical protein